MSTRQQISLYYREGSSDKVYHVQLEDLDDRGCLVNFQYGRRGTSLTAGTKTSSPVSLEQATKIYDKLVREKTAKGYSPGEEGVRYQQTSQADRVTGLRPQLLNHIESGTRESYLTNTLHWMQEKKNGRRVQVRKAQGTVIGSNKLGLEIPLPEPLVDVLQSLQPSRLDLDGELVGMTYHGFDLTHFNLTDLGPAPYRDRYARLCDLLVVSQSPLLLVETARTPAEKQALFAQLMAAHAEGVVYKDPNAPYVPGRPESGGAQLKDKFTATGTFVVRTVNAKRSVGVGLLDATGRLIDTGNVTIPANQAVPAKDSLIEVQYLYAIPTSHKLYQPVYLGPRDDIRTAECLLTQLKYQPASEDDDV